MFDAICGWTIVLSCAITRKKFLKHEAIIRFLNIDNIYQVKVKGEIPSIRKLNGKQLSLTNPKKINDYGTTWSKRTSNFTHNQENI